MWNYILCDHEFSIKTAAYERAHCAVIELRHKYDATVQFSLHSLGQITASLPNAQMHLGTMKKLFYIFIQGGT